jgi:signal transduction histidine kinase
VSVTLQRNFERNDRAPRVSSLRGLFTPRVPSVPFIALLTGSLALIATFFAPDVDLRGTPPHLWIWLIANVGSAMTMTAMCALLVALHDRPPMKDLATGTKRVLLVIGLLLGAAAASIVRAELDSTLEWEGYVHRFGFLFWAGVFSYTGVAIASNVYVNLHRTVRENERALRDRLVEISRTRSLIAQADENVRREVAEVLHGTVQSRLLAAELRLEQLQTRTVDDSPDVAAEASELAGVLRDLREREVRTMSHQLHPPALRVGLLAAVRSLLARIEGQFDLEIHLELSPGMSALDDPASPRLPEAVRLTVYRAIEEAAQNTVRHGKATTAWVGLDLLPGPRLQLRFDDDGIGVADEVNGGLGLASIAARVEGRGGTWSLGKSPRGGARLEMTIPFRATDLRGQSGTPQSAKMGLHRRHGDHQDDVTP